MTSLSGREEAQQRPYARMHIHFVLVGERMRGMDKGRGRDGRTGRKEIEGGVRIGV
jgi:hypothetical protein